MNLIHLTSQQTKRRNFDHPLLDYSTECDGEVLDQLIAFFVTTRSKQSYDDLILGNLILVKWVVGRYLHHWPESRPFAEDMASEGIVAVTTIVNELVTVVPAAQLRAMMVHRIKRKIEEFLNDNRSIVNASLRTNQSRLREGRELEAIVPVQLDERLVAGRRDENLVNIDILDNFAALDSIDKEEFIDIVLLMLERYPQVLESELPERIKTLVESIIRAVKAN